MSLVGSLGICGEVPRWGGMRRAEYTAHPFFVVFCSIGEQLHI